jgi:spore germination protein YaaH
MSSDYIISGWFYPTVPCNYRSDLIPLHKGLNQICGEFMRFIPSGDVQEMTEASDGNGGRSPAVIQACKSQVKELYCTLSGKSETGVGEMLKDPIKVNNVINKIVNYCKTHDFHLDVNIEGLASFTHDECIKHAKFLKDLATAVKSAGYKVRIVTVAEGRDYHGNWRNSLLYDNPCDYVVYMIYDLKH